MKGLVIGVVVGIVIVGLVASGYFIYTRKIVPNKKGSATVVANVKNGNEIIATVGDEAIYQSDLDQAKKYLAVENQTDDQVVDKIMEESVLLQEGKAIVKLTSDIYSSPNKDYAKRLEAVKKVRDFYMQEMTGSNKKVVGSLISIWADNYSKEPFDLDANKKAAFEKITPLRDAVKAKQISPEQAAQEIVKDSSWRSVDYSYDKNAFMGFEMEDPKQEVVRKSEINGMIWNLKEGDTTPVVYVEISNREKFYAFAKATKVETKSDTKTYDQWLAGVKQKYKYDRI